MFDVQQSYTRLRLDFKNFKTCIGFVDGFLTFQGVLRIEEEVDFRVWPVP